MLLISFLELINQLVSGIGITAINACNAVGSFVLFFVTTVQTAFSTRLRLHKLFVQMERIGVNSLLITIITGTSSGAVLAIQTYKGFQQFGGEDFMGPVIAMSMTRELGPVLTGLMVTGRAGSAIAAELGTMRITEQIDALRTLCINTHQYLIVPRILAGILILPFLTLIAMVSGILGGLFVSTQVLGINGEEFMVNIRTFTELSDITGGLIKASVFGLILTWVGAYKGYTTSGGAREVGQSTTQAVVFGSILIIVADYFLTVFLFGP